MKLKILHLESSESDAGLVNQELKKSNLDFEIKRADTKANYKDALQNFSPDIILSDNALPSFDSLEALEIAWENNPDIPFIVVSAAGDVRSVANIVRHGAFDYILKNSLKSLPGTISAALNNKATRRPGQNWALQTSAETDKTVNQLTERLQLATRVCDIGIWDWDIMNNKMIWDKITFDHYGLPYQEVPVDYDTAEMSMHPEDRPRVRHEIQQALRGDKEYDTEFRVVWPDKSIHCLKEVGAVQRDNSGTAIRMVTTNHDITARKRMADQLLENKLNAEKEKAQVILLAQEKERESIGYELHDNVNQVLASAKMYIDLYKASTKEEKTIKAKSKEYLFIAMEEIRKLSKQLVVSHINNIGLIGSIEGFVSDMTALQLFTITFNSGDERIDSLASLKKIALFRILQEQMKNIVSYSQAKNVAIDLQTSNNHVTLSIKDDGIGFDATKPRKGLGISHIFERANLHKGQVELKTSLNKGCTMVIDIPFD